MIIQDDIEEKGDRTYVSATVKLINAEKPSEEIITKAYAREADQKKGMDVSQVTGATSSYARKYALNGMFAIDDNKDADTDEYRQVSQEAPKQNPLQPIIEEINGFVKSKGIDPKVVTNIIQKNFSKQSSKELTLDEAKTLLNILRNSYKGK